MLARCEHVHILNRPIKAVTLAQPRAHWITTLDAAGVPTGLVQTMAEAIRDPQVVARSMILPITPRGGGPRFTAAGNPVKMTGLPDPQSRDPAPALDGDRDAITAWLDATPATS